MLRFSVISLILEKTLRFMGYPIRYFIVLITLFMIFRSNLSTGFDTRTSRQTERRKLNRIKQFKVTKFIDFYIQNKVDTIIISKYLLYRFGPFRIEVGIYIIY